jgi:DNA polymerase-3 subunit alpha
LSFVIKIKIEDMKNQQFVHLNVHSHYSLYNGVSTIRQLVDVAIKERMPGIAITDYGNMFGIMEFIDYVSSINKKRKRKKEKPFKPIIGCELYVAKHGPKEGKEGVKDYKGYHLTVLAKNLQGYKNLVKIVSNAWTDGFYASPRTDRMDLEKYHEGLIVLSGGVGSEVYAHARKEEISELDDTITWYKQVFGDDFYLEMRRDADYDLSKDTPSDLMIEQEKVNQVLIQKSKEFGVKVVATNDVQYAAPEDLAVYNIQRCIAVGKTMEEYDSDPLRFRWLTGKDFIFVLHDTKNDVCSICFIAILFLPVLFKEVSIEGNMFVWALFLKLLPILYSVLVWPQVDFAFCIEKRL